MVWQKCSGIRRSYLAEAHFYMLIVVLFSNIKRIDSATSISFFIIYVANEIEGGG